MQVCPDLELYEFRTHEQVIASKERRNTSANNACVINEVLFERFRDLQGSSWLFW